MVSSRLIEIATAGFNRMPWLWRRVIVFAIILWSMGLLTYIAAVGDSETQRDIAFYVSGCLISTMGSYLGISAIDHQNERKANLAAAISTPPDGDATTNTTVEVKT